MIVDIIEKPPINVDKLNENISQYIKLNGDTPYIFVNDETEKAMLSGFEVIPVERGITLYRGCKVFIDNTLPYGQIELR